MNAPDNTQLSRQTVLVVAALLLVSWGGEIVHNALEFPDMTLLSPENSGPGLLSLLLFVIWWLFGRSRRIPMALIAAWGLVHLLLGAVISVIPLKLLPFAPEQSLQHYGAHLIYGLAQIPLLIYAYFQLRKPEVQS